MTCPRRACRAVSAANTHRSCRRFRRPGRRPLPAPSPPAAPLRLVLRPTSAYNAPRNEPIKQELVSFWRWLALLVWSFRRFAVPPIPEDLEDLEPTAEEWATAVRLAELILGELERRHQPTSDEEGA